MSNKVHYYVVEQTDGLYSVLLPNGRYLIVTFDETRPAGAEGFNQHIDQETWFSYATPTWEIQIELTPSRYVMVVTLHNCHNSTKSDLLYTYIVVHLKSPSYPYTADVLLQPVRRVVQLLEQWLQVLETKQ